MTSLSVQAESGALLVRRNDLATLVVSGPDALSWLQGMITSNLAKLDSNQFSYGLVLDRQGKILTDLVASQLDDRYLLAMDASVAPKTHAHLDHFLVMEDADINPWNKPHSFFLVLGPRAHELAAMKHPAITSAASGRFFGREAAWILSTQQNHASVGSDLASLDESFTCINHEPFDELRTSLGIPKFGVDFGPANYPMEIGLDDHAISFEKGCYVGQEVVVKLRSRGNPVRVLRRLQFQAGATAPLPKETVILPSGKEIGKVSSTGLSSSGNPIAFALLRRADSESTDIVIVGGQEAKIISAIPSV